MSGSLLRIRYLYGVLRLMGSNNMDKYTVHISYPSTFLECNSESQYCPHTLGDNTERQCGNWCPQFEVFSDMVRLHCCKRDIQLEKGG